MAFNRKINIGEVNYFIHSWIPRYKLLPEESFVYNSFGRRSIRHSIGMTGEILHPFMMVIPIGKVRLEPLEVMPIVHLGSHQNNCGPMVDAMEGDLPSVHGNVLEATHHQIALGVQGPSGIVRRQLEGFQFLRQG